MAGHSRWAQVKHRKAGADAKRGAQFSKLARLISVAAREGGSNPEANPKLRQAVDQARSLGLPKENIERALTRGSSAGEERTAEVEYEAYGPGGCAILARGVTDNPNRTTAEVKHLLDEHGGKLSSVGSVAWLFSRSLIATFALGDRPTQDVELALIDAGAENTEVERGRVLATVALERAATFEAKAEGSGFVPVERAYAAVPKQYVALGPEDSARAERLVTALEEHPDMVEVATNIAGEP